MSSWFGTVAVDDPSSRFLVALSVETGAVMWQMPGVPTSEMWTTSLVISDGTLYVANTSGEVMAVSTDDGTVRWQVAIESAGDVDPDMLIRNPAAPFIVFGDDGLFVVRGDQSVVRLDPETGEVTGSVDVADAVGSSSIMTIPQVRGSTLALLVGHLVGGISDVREDVTPITVLTLDASTLEVDHRIDFADLRGGNMVLAEDNAYIPVAESAGAPAHVARIDLASGEVMQPFGEVSSRALLFLSVSGDTLIVAAGDTRNVSFVDRRTGELRATVETRYSGGSFSQPVHLWNGQPIAIDGRGKVHLIVEDANTIPAATPAATPG